MPSAPNIPEWQASTDYNEGDVALPADYIGLMAVAGSDGTSGATEPAWPGVGESINDGDMSWTMALAAFGCPLRPNEQSLQEVRETLQRIKFCLTVSLPKYLTVMLESLAASQVMIREIQTAVSGAQNTLLGFETEPLLDEAGAALLDEDGLPLYEEIGSYLARTLQEE